MKSSQNYFLILVELFLEGFIVCLVLLKLLEQISEFLVDCISDRFIIDYSQSIALGIDLFVGFFEMVLYEIGKERSVERDFLLIWLDELEIIDFEEAIHLLVYPPEIIKNFSMNYRFDEIIQCISTLFLLLGLKGKVIAEELHRFGKLILQYHVFLVVI